jgi:MFS superfamily sulfate permease-like transporter
VFERYFSGLQLSPGQYVSIPSDIFSGFRFPDIIIVSEHPYIFKNAAVICFVASLETLLSLTAIDKLDPMNRVSPPNRELVAQGTGNLISGLAGGLPVTAVIVRSSANAEAGARTRWSAFTHGIWMLMAILFAATILNKIPYAVLAVVLIRTGYNLAKPKMVAAVYRQGREQFVPFIVTVVAILFTDLLIGVVIGVGYSIIYLIKHTYRAGFTVREETSGHNKKFIIELALNVSFLNKQRFITLFDNIPEYSIVEIRGTDSVYIDHDVLEIFQEFKAKAHGRHIELHLKDIPEVKIIGLH